MHDDLKDAQRALDRGRPDEALVFLWNVLEPARMAEDRSALRRIRALASRVVSEGDTSAKRDAERLLEGLRDDLERREEPSVAVARPVEEIEILEHEWIGSPEAQTEEVTPRGRGWGGLMILLAVLAIIVINLLSRLL